MSTYEASASFSERSSLLALRNTSAIPPRPSAARFFCSSTRELTRCLTPPSTSLAVVPLAPLFIAISALLWAAPLPDLAAEPLGLFSRFVGMCRSSTQQEQQDGGQRSRPGTGIREPGSGR